MTDIYKTKNGIDLKYTVYTCKNITQSCVVLLPGIPYNPEKTYDLITKLTNQHDVYLIRYDGTWGSSGKFLAENPTTSVDDFMATLSGGTISNNSSEPYKNIFVIGTSFGGGLALTLKDGQKIQAVCVLSPVISYKSVQGIDTLGSYLQTQCAEHYTFEPTDMERLITDNIIFPEEQMSLPANKLLVFAGEHDEQIPIKDISAFCLKRNIKLHSLPTGHITLSKVEDDIFEKLNAFFEKHVH